MPLVDQARTLLGRKPREVSGDTGFATEANLSALAERRIAAYLPPGRSKHGDAGAGGARRLTDKPLMAAMAKKRSGPAAAPATACENRPSSPSSVKSSTPVASVNSCSEASTRSEPSRR